MVFDDRSKLEKYLMVTALGQWGFFIWYYFSQGIVFSVFYGAFAAVGSLGTFCNQKHALVLYGIGALGYTGWTSWEVYQNLRGGDYGLFVWHLFIAAYQLVVVVTVAAEYWTAHRDPAFKRLKDEGEVEGSADEKAKVGGEGKQRASASAAGGSGQYGASQAA